MDFWLIQHQGCHRHEYNVVCVKTPDFVKHTASLRMSKPIISAPLLSQFSSYLQFLANLYCFSPTPTITVTMKISEQCKIKREKYGTSSTGM